jgi:hypothetical protein
MNYLHRFVFYCAHDLSGDIITNIMARHKHFVCKIEMHPSVFIVAVSDFGMRIFSYSIFF